MIWNSLFTGNQVFGGIAGTGGISGIVFGTYGDSGMLAWRLGRA